MGKPTGGSIELLGLDHLRCEVALKQRAAYAGPELNYSAWGTIAKAARFVRGFRPTWDDAYAEHLSRLFGLDLDSYIATLSFGDRTKVAILLALAWKPQVIVLDEPTTGLDAQSRRLLFNELLEVIQDEARTVLISSHQIVELERFADQVGILHKGKLLAEGSIAELLQQRYCMVQWAVSDPSPFKAAEGIWAMEQVGHLHRAVIDARLCSVQSLEAKGAREIRTQGLTLEELFLALTK